MLVQANKFSTARRHVVQRVATVSCGLTLLILSEKLLPESISAQALGFDPPLALAAPPNTGPPVEAVDYSWQVGLRIRDGSRAWRCGGTLIAPRLILTAAHCLDAARPSAAGQIIRIGIDSIEVFHGDNVFAAGDRLVLDRSWPVTFHPGWKRSGVIFANDAAILRLAEPVVTATVAPVRRTPFDSGTAVTSGWGNYDETDLPSAVLRATSVPIVDNVTCQDTLKAIDVATGGATAYATYLHRSTLCSVSKIDDACVSDSGGPLVATGIRPQTIGIVSWGLDLPCGRQGPTGELVGAYTRTSEIATWIVQVTGNTSAVANAPQNIGTIDR